MDKIQLIELVNKMYDLHQTDEMECHTCQDELDCLAELVLVGYECRDMIPAVQHHMDCCQSCREMFRGLVEILKAQQAGQC